MNFRVQKEGTGLGCYHGHRVGWGEGSPVQTGACMVRILHRPQNRECQAFSSVFSDVEGKSAHHEQASKSGVRLFIKFRKQTETFPPAKAKTAPTGILQVEKVHG